MSTEFVWYDSEAMYGKGIPGEYSSTEEVNLGPTNKRELPCTGCENVTRCQTGFDCVAFRNWCNKGDYADEAIGLRLKAI